MPQNDEQETGESYAGRLIAPQSHTSRRFIHLAIGLISLVTVLTFEGALRNELVDWDDQQTLVDNTAYQGLGWNHLRWMFTTGFAGHYQPLTWLSFAVDHRLWGGVSPPGFHLTNLLLHLITSVGFFFVALGLLQRNPFSRSVSMNAENASTPGNPRGPHCARAPVPAAGYVAATMAALLFSIHPLRVESVAWATERRDVLSGAWIMLALLAYLRATSAASRSARNRALALSVGCYCLSLLSKATAITFPIVLLVLDVYPLGRFAQGLDRNRNRTLRGIGLEKALFLLPAVLVGLVALWAQSQAGALWTLEAHAMGLRIGQAFYGVAFYLWKSVWPTGLIPLYEQRPGASALDAINVVSAGVVVAMTMSAWLLRRRLPALLAAWSVYVVLLLPVLGLAQSGPQIVADRYSYLSCMPWALVFGGAAGALWESRRRRRRMRSAIVIVCGLLITMLAVAARSQTRIWKDSYTLWTTVVERAPSTGLAHANLAVVLNNRGEYEIACRHSSKALGILPGNRVAHIALARCSAELGDLAAARSHYATALQIRSGDPLTMTRLAVVETRTGNFDRAEQLYRDMITLDPESASARFHLAGFLAGRQRADEARGVFKKVLSLDPTHVQARFRLGVLLLANGESAEAVEVFEIGLVHAPDDALLGAKLAWVLATSPMDGLRDGARARDLATSALESSPGSQPAAEALAAAHAETGDFEAAMETAESLLAGAFGPLSESMRARLIAQLARYRRGERLRE